MHTEQEMRMLDIDEHSTGEKFSLDINTLRYFNELITQWPSHWNTDIGDLIMQWLSIKIFVKYPVQ